MPNNATTAAARLSTAPMMDGTDSGEISAGCVMPCAAHVYVSIAWFRAASCCWWFALQSKSTQGETCETASRCVAACHHRAKAPAIPWTFCYSIEDGCFLEAG